MHIQETPEKLILQDRPGCIWLLSLFFILIGSMFVLGPLFLFSDRAEQPWYVSAIAIFMGLAALGAGLWQARRVPLSTTTFDRLDRSISMITWGLAGRSGQRWTFNDASALVVVEEKDSEGDPIYRLQLVLRSGETAWLTAVHLHVREPYDQAAGRVRSFLGSGITLESSRIE
jgi:hypothetical protein